jgi:hypothetical protein
MMKSPVTFFCLLIFSVTATAQTVEVTNSSGFKAPIKNDFFVCILPATDSTILNFVGTIKATGSGKNSGIEELFVKTKEKALELGANAYRLTSYDRDSISKTATLIVQSFYGTDSALDLNFQYAEKNVVYIFGDAEKSNKTYSFKVNGVKKEIKGGTFYKQVLNPGEEVKINKGGITGATIWITGKENRAPTFLTLSGFGLGGGPLPPGVAGVALNTGRINYVERGLGPLLVQVLKQHE